MPKFHSATGRTSSGRRPMSPKNSSGIHRELIGMHLWSWHNILNMTMRIHGGGGARHWGIRSLVPPLIGPPSHWSPSHWSPNSLVPQYINGAHWPPISLVPHLIGPASHWSPISLPILEPLLCFATPEPVTFFNILISYDQAPLRAAIKMANPEHDEFRQSRIVSTRHLIRCQYYTLESHGTNWFFWYEKPQQHGRILQISGGENFGESTVTVTHYWS